MPAHLLYETATGEAVSIASRDELVASPLPAHLTDRVLTDVDYDALVGGWARWDAGTLTIVPTGQRTPAEEEARAANLELILSNMTAALETLAPIVGAADVPAVPAGTLNTAQLSNAMRTLRDNVQEHRVALRVVATNLRRVIKYLRDDLDTAE